MRKDLRIGLGIGGVLLAVLVVALLVHSKPVAKKASQASPAHPESTEPPEEPDTPPVLPPPDGGGMASVTPPVAPPAALPPPDPIIDDPFTDPHRAAPSNDWEVLLATGQMHGPPVSATPPTPGGVGARGSVGVHPPMAGTGRGMPPTARGARDDRTVGVGLFGGSTGTGSLEGPAATKSGSVKTHVIQQGETFSSIARDRYGNAKYFLRIIDANPNIDPTRLKPGTTINLPDLAAEAHASAAPAVSSSRLTDGNAVDSAREYRVQSGDNLWRISSRLYGTSSKMDAIYEANKAAIGPNRERLKLGMVLRLPEPPTIALR